MSPVTPLHEDSSLYQLIVETRRLFHALAQASSELSQDTGVNASMRAVLEALYPDAQATVPEIARRKQVTRQHIQQIVNQLLAAGLVETLDNPAHKRSPLIALSPAGQGIFERIISREVELLRMLEGEFDPAATAAAVETLQEIRSYFSSERWEKSLARLRNK